MATSLYDYYASINRNKKWLEGGYYQGGSIGATDPGQ